MVLSWPSTSVLCLIEKYRATGFCLGTTATRPLKTHINLNSRDGYIFIFSVGAGLPVSIDLHS